MAAWQDVPSNGGGALDSCLCVFCVCLSVWMCVYVWVWVSLCVWRQEDNLLGFSCGLWDQTQVFLLVCQAPYRLSHRPSLPLFSLVGTSGKGHLSPGDILGSLKSGILLTG